MLKRLIGGSLVAAAIVPLALVTLSARTPNACTPDSKLIGRIELSADYRPGTWWYISKNGFDAAGIDDVAAFVNSVLGTSLTEDEVPQFLTDGAAEIDFNGNGYVCAASLRGTRANLGDPTYANYLFSVTDDKHADDVD